MPPRPRIDPADLLPLKAIEFEILLALHDQESHGYGLAKAIEARTAGRLRLQPANLYRRVHRLVELALVADAGRQFAEDTNDERRRYFRITPLGERVLTAEARRLQDQVRAATSRRILRRTGRSS